jgi:hypothetical protein
MLLRGFVCTPVHYNNEDDTDETSELRMIARPHHSSNALNDSSVTNLVSDLNWIPNRMRVRQLARTTSVTKDSVGYLKRTKIFRDHSMKKISECELEKAKW